MILFLLFPVLTLLFVSAYGWIISELLLEWSLAMICGHLFNNMLVWEGYTWNRSAKSGEKKMSIYLFLLLISHLIPVFLDHLWAKSEGFLFIYLDFGGCCLHHHWCVGFQQAVKLEMFIMLQSHRHGRQSGAVVKTQACTLMVPLWTLHLSEPFICMWSDKDLSFVWVQLIL